jgi:hypothetical protein
MRFVEAGLGRNIGSASDKALPFEEEGSFVLM